MSDDVKFRGFVLAKLIRACSEKSKDLIVKPYTYEIDYYPKVGNSKPIRQFKTAGATQTTYGKNFRMIEGMQHAIQAGSNDWDLITEDEYNRFLEEYKNI